MVFAQRAAPRPRRTTRRERAAVDHPVVSGSIAKRAGRRSIEATVHSNPQATHPARVSRAAAATAASMGMGAAAAQWARARVVPRSVRVTAAWLPLPPVRQLPLRWRGSPRNRWRPTRRSHKRAATTAAAGGDGRRPRRRPRRRRVMRRGSRRLPTSRSRSGSRTARSRRAARASAPMASRSSSKRSGGRTKAGPMVSRPTARNRRAVAAAGQGPGQGTPPHPWRTRTRWRVE